MRLLGAALVSFVCFGANELANRRAPGFSLPDSSFKRYDLQDFRGKWVLIDFMITNCPHWEELSRTLEDMKKKYEDRVARRMCCGGCGGSPHPGWVDTTMGPAYAPKIRADAEGGVFQALKS